MLIKESNKPVPKRVSDDTVNRKEEVDFALGMLDAGQHVEIRTKNFLSWKAEFYRRRKKECPEKVFRFNRNKVDEEVFTVWRVS